MSEKENKTKDIKEIKPEREEIPMRELQSSDLFSVLSILGKLDIKDEFIKFFEGDPDIKLPEYPEHKGKTPTKAEQKKIDEYYQIIEAEQEKQGLRIMADLVQKLLVNAKKAETEIQFLLADLTDKTVDEISTLNLIDYTSLLIRLGKKEDMRDFISSIISLLR